MSDRFARLPFKALTRLHELKGNELLLYTWLCLHRGDDGQCNPGDDLLMEETQLTRSPFNVARKGLIDTGWVECDFSTRSYRLAFHPEKQDEPPSRKPGQSHPENRDEVIPKSRMVHPEKQDGSSRKPGCHIGRTDHEQTMNSKGNTAHSREKPLTEIHLALLRILGWGLAPSVEHYEQVALVAEELVGLAEHYGQEYAPTPERIARFPDYIKAGQFSRWGPRAITNHWKRAVDWMNSAGEHNGTSTNRRKTRAELDEEILRARDYKSFNDP